MTSRTQSTAPVGCLLSGGIDSAAIFAIASELGVTAFSGIRDDPACADTTAINTLLDARNAPSVKLTVDDMGAMNGDLQRVFENLDDPFASIMTLAICLYLTAHRQGHRVMLDGVDGDLVISLTRDYPATLIRGGHYRSARAELAAMVARGRIAPVAFSSTLLRALVPLPIRQLRQAMSSKERISRAVDDSLLAASLARDPKVRQRYLDHDRDRTTHHRSVEAQHAWWLSQPFIAVALERYDRVAALCHIEPRHPLLDRRIVEFCLNLPWQLKVRSGWSKWILRRAMASSLPAGLPWRTDKPHLGWHYTEAFLQRNWPAIRSTVQDVCATRSGFIDPAKALPLFESLTYDRPDSTDPLVIYMLCLWLRQYDVSR